MNQGKNACKGQGFVKMTEKACVDKLGRGLILRLPGATRRGATTHQA